MSETVSHSEPRASASAAVAAIRTKMLEGLAPKRDFAEAVGRTLRTVDNWIAGGLPVVRIGRTPYVRLDAAREWLMKHGTPDRTPRGRGRPSKRA